MKRFFVTFALAFGVMILPSLALASSQSGDHGWSDRYGQYDCLSPAAVDAGDLVGSNQDAGGAEGDPDELGGGFRVSPDTPDGQPSENASSSSTAVRASLCTSLQYRSV